MVTITPPGPEILSSGLTASVSEWVTGEGDSVCAYEAQEVHPLDHAVDLEPDGREAAEVSFREVRSPQGPTDVEHLGRGPG